MPAQPARSPVSSNVSSLRACSFGPWYTGDLVRADRAWLWCRWTRVWGGGEPRLPAHLPSNTCVSAGSPTAPTSWPGCVGGTQGGLCRKTGQGAPGWAWPLSPSLTQSLGMREKPSPQGKLGSESA